MGITGTEVGGRGVGDGGCPECKRGVCLDPGVNVVLSNGGNWNSVGADVGAGTSWASLAQRGREGEARGRRERWGGSPGSKRGEGGPREGGTRGTVCVVFGGGG